MRNRKKKNKYMLILVVILAVSIGYAAVSTTLKFSGTATVMKQSWDVHWSNPVVVEGSVNSTNVPTIGENQGDPSNTKLTWTANLKIPGDYYEFTVDTANSGTVDVMISNINLSVSPALPDYITFDVVYEDEQPIEIGHKLAKATKNGNTIIPTTEKLRVRVYYDPEKATLETINAIPQEGISYTFTYNITYSKSTSDAVPREDTKMYYAFYSAGCNVDDIFYDDYDFVQQYQYAAYFDTLPLEFGTSNAEATNKYYGGVTINYKKLYLEYKLYRDKYDSDYYYNSKEEARYSGRDEDDIEYYETKSYAPKIFYAYKINSNRNVIKNYICINNNNKLVCEDREAYPIFKMNDFIPVFGEYNSNTGKGCRVNPNYSNEFDCISSDGKMKVAAYADTVDVIDYENHVLYYYDGGGINGPVPYYDED